MKIYNPLSQPLQKGMQSINQKLERLSTRERYMVLAMLGVLLISLLGWSLWSIHTAANAQQKRFQSLNTLFSNMQSNAVVMTVDANNAEASIADKVQRVSMQQGLSIQSQQVGDKIQIISEHRSYAVLANFITALAQAGLNIEKMQLNTNNHQLKLTATVY